MTPLQRGVPLATVVAAWGRIGVLGFGGPPAHVSMLRALCVADRRWLSAEEFEDGIAATNLLPGPASTQLAIFCAWRVAGAAGAIVGGLAFVLPGLALILALGAVFLASNPPPGVLGAAAGASGAVPAVALAAALTLLPSSWARVGKAAPGRTRWALYAALGAAAAATLGPYLVAVIAACGATEMVVRHGRRPGQRGARHGAMGLGVVRAPIAGLGLGGLAAVAWVALKVGALSYGGGFVIVPLMQHDAVSVYRWMTPGQFLDAVALGQITPGPVVHTVAVVGYAASGLPGALVAAAVAFAPSFVMVLVLGPHFDRLRRSRSAQSFLTGAGACAIGAIAGSAIPLGVALSQWWQLAVLVASGVWLLALRRHVLTCLLAAGAVGAVAGLLGAPLPH